MADELVETIKDYFNKRGLTWPNFDNSMKFAMTEIAEVYELDLDRSGTWVRNNPQNKPKFNKQDLEEELGDAVFMLIVAGISEDLDVITAMKNKMNRKLGAGGEKKIKDKAQLSFLSDQEIEELNKLYRTEK